METIKTLAGVVSKEKFNANKYLRQLKSVIKWKNQGGKGVLEATTAFGKTFVARITIGKMAKSGKLKKVIVIVPRISLKNQWEKELEQFTNVNIEVHVINGYVLDKERKDCDLLILDEIHLFASDKFKQLFDLTNYKFVLGLTATLKRLDGKEKFIIDRMKVFDKITHSEALKNGWVADLIEINIPVFLTKKEREIQNELSKKIAEGFQYFEDFQTMKDCCTKDGARAYVKANDLILEASQVSVKANICMRNIRKRKDFMDNCEQKLIAAKEIIQRLRLKTVTFSETIKFPEKLKESFPKALIYHSDLKTVEHEGEDIQQKIYKTNGKPYHAFKKKMCDSDIPFTEEEVKGEYVFRWKEFKRYKLTAAKQKEMMLDSIKNGDDKLIFTAKALDQGFDVDTMELGIETSRSNNPTQQIQRKG